MKLIRLKVKNLFSLGQVDISLQGRGLTLVTGYSEDDGNANGAGKSSLANKAIIWTLYGTTTHGLRADNVLNRWRGKKAEGQIDFEGVDLQTYLLI
jgi:DNA repair exonuclease SbcCD ATPase subunit